ncbi:MAG: TSUP family transporter, partial [Actinomycetota bacterium]|nr:TSUP family transporter [Actinomycetota bacterium]
MISALGLGLLIGVLLGLLGGGGSILAVPALVYGAGAPLTAAIPTSLLVVGISSAAAVVPRLRQGQVQWRIAAVFGAAGGGAAFAGSAVNRLVDPRVLLIGFAALMVAAG